jgi:membrane-associated phospholipid phosphatase
MDAPIAIIANGAMMASTPIDGGHYFIDLAAGIAVAMLAILAARWVSDRVADRRGAAMVTAPLGATAATPAE